VQKQETDQLSGVKEKMNREGKGSQGRDERRLFPDPRPLIPVFTSSLFRSGD